MIKKWQHLLLKISEITDLLNKSALEMKQFHLGDVLRSTFLWSTRGFDVWIYVEIKDCVLTSIIRLTTSNEHYVATF
jgi:hypothetical protein